MSFIFRIPRVIITGANSHKTVHELIEISSHQSSIIISDGNKVKPEVESTLVANLNSIGIKTAKYNKIDQAVTHTAVNEIASLAAELDADLIISLGGRYAMHAGRLVAMLRSNGGDILDYSNTDNIKNYPATFVAVATTASSGAAISSCVCYTNEASGKRVCFADPKLLPSIVVLDPEMTSWLSPSDIANDGMISFGFAIEALASKLSTPVTDSCALEAINNLVTWLPRIYSNSNNVHYRERLMFTQQLVSMANSNVFANMICKLAGQVESMTHIGMGNTVAALLPLVIEHFERLLPEKMTKLTDAMLRADKSLSYGADGSPANLMRSVITRLDMPLKLSFLGLEQTHIETLIDSLSDETMFTNAPLSFDKESIRQLLLSAL
jgi:alcohol dehydrogenase class IV